MNSSTTSRQERSNDYNNRAPLFLSNNRSRGEVKKDKSSSKPCGFAVDTMPRIARRRVSLDLTSHAASLKRKRVRFALDENEQEVKTAVYSYPPVSEELVPTLFWTRKESKEILKKQSRLARECVKSTPEVIDSIYFLHGYKVTDNSNMTSERAHSILAKSNCRGLERFMTRLMSNHRAWSTDQLLSIQERAWQSEDDEEEEDLELLLRVWSLKLSAAPSLYARQVAAGDQMEAARRNFSLPGIIANDKQAAAKNSTVMRQPLRSSCDPTERFGAGASAA